MKQFLLLILFILSFPFSAQEMETYTVKDNDTLAKIAREKLNDPTLWREFLQYNDIDNPHKIIQGMVLKIPPTLSKKLSPKENQVADLKFSFGKVEYKTQDKSWTQAKLKQGFLDNEWIRTGSDSSAEIEYRDETKTIIQMRQNSNIKIEKQKEKGLNLLEGSIFLKVFNKEKNNKDIKYSVTTPSATIGVRGTVFYISLDKEETSLVGCYQGEVDVSAQNKTVVVPKGYGTRVIKGQAPMEPFKLLTPIVPKPALEK
ncbi:MAG TPA: FecR domain-containing protein [Leptospiraceae bacterium]|nr:FecR domain-containing protein [Leptospiraceae bacterium]HMX35404.1 FecR domain-containing protein [Leptospiraceae bacterium]HMY32215.1 FecR domain-containing protein [Leptospiraceae bacterium]HNC01578.1 FecR domain-containing protein [Leptospiraceae bacterium]HNE11548.1 FecR domain-containing protein [Leptospiraceae bacterium]